MCLYFASFSFAGSSLSETHPEPPVSLAVLIPRAPEAHPKALRQTTWLQQLPAAVGSRRIRLGPKGVWGPQCPACGRAPGVQPGCQEDPVELPVELYHPPPGLDAGGSAGLFHSQAGEHSATPWSPQLHSSFRVHVCGPCVLWFEYKVIQMSFCMFNRIVLKAMSAGMSSCPAMMVAD